MIDQLQQAQQIARDALANVDASQLGDSTPCDNWNVGQLIDHLVGAQLWATATMQGEPMTDTGEGSSNGDYQAAFNQAATDAVDAFSADGALDRMVNAGFGDMPAPALLGMAATDTFAHTWDLAKATGQSTDLAPDLAAQLLAGAQQAIPDSFRTDDGSMFKPATEAPADASNADRLAAFLGRDVN